MNHGCWSRIVLENWFGIIKIQVKLLQFIKKVLKILQDIIPNESCIVVPSMLQQYMSLGKMQKEEDVLAIDIGSKMAKSFYLVDFHPWNWNWN
ncbi:uncharacterized protein G2W53_008185 [Senna tora]|uniref:Uncharacterized protein n=1 Tax=Senna tora TaxID=362788 RepID=A0A834X8B5_9FABA|nr:uncharacterized protein G2W53_008185 [Senna tora]